MRYVHHIPAHAGLTRQLSTTKAHPRSTARSVPPRLSCYAMTTVHGHNYLARVQSKTSTGRKHANEVHVEEGEGSAADLRWASSSHRLPESHGRHHHRPLLARRMSLSGCGRRCHCIRTQSSRSCYMVPSRGTAYRTQGLATKPHGPMAHHPFSRNDSVTVRTRM